jgi:nucleoside-diphosphate-sugar epimerase
MAVLVTGALGCIGAWTVYHLLQEHETVVSLDVAEGGHRLDYLLTPEDRAQVQFIKGDISHYDTVAAVFQNYGITQVIHLAALQVPFCRADPVKGAQVNVVGTVNIFEAARQHAVSHVAYASSVAVYGAPDDYDQTTLADDAPLLPRTLYGVYKQADEGIARVYWLENKVSSTALRPHTVYGVGRDQGLTSDPTKAMLAAAAGKPFHINFGGRILMQAASDTALQFIEAARRSLGGAYAFTMGGDPVTVADIVREIRHVVPGADITHAENSLPFPEAFDDSPLRSSFKVYSTPLAAGIADTIARFQELLAAGKISA